VVMEE